MIDLYKWEFILNELVPAGYMYKSSDISFLKSPEDLFGITPYMTIMKHDGKYKLDLWGSFNKTQHTLLSITDTVDEAISIGNCFISNLQTNMMNEKISMLKELKF